MTRHMTVLNSARAGERLSYEESWTIDRLHLSLRQDGVAASDPPTADDWERLAALAKEWDDKEFPPLLYTGEKCGNWCEDGETRDGSRRIPCDYCGGSGQELTPVGAAMWAMAKRAASS